jgi:multidrug resistance efflux pump
MSAGKIARSLLTALILVQLSVACRRPPVAGEDGSATELARPARVVGVGRVEPEMRMVDLASEVAGEVLAVTAQAGDRLARGAPLVTLSDAIEKAKVEQAAAGVESRRSTVAAVDAALRGAVARAENAGRGFARAETLFAGNSETQAGLDAARAENLIAIEEVRRLEADASSARAERAQGEAGLRVAQAELKRRTIRAPADGRLLSLDVAIGSFIRVGEPVGTFANESQPCARCEVDEAFADAVREGQTAFIRPMGGVDSLAAGSVTFVGPYLRAKSLFADEVGDLEDRRVREVTIMLDSGAAVLLGTRVECVIAVR